MNIHEIGTPYHFEGVAEAAEAITSYNGERRALGLQYEIVRMHSRNVNAGYHVRVLDGTGNRLGHLRARPI